MSHLTLIVIHQRSINIAQTHWRTAKLLLEQGFEGTFWNGELLQPELDAGYILIDFDQQVLINAQDAFEPSVKEGWALVTV